MARAHLTGTLLNAVVKSPVLATVWVKRSWTDEWIYVPYMRALRVVEEVAPATSTAQLRWHYGYIKREDRGSFQLFLPQWINGWFVAILVHDYSGTAPLWLGVIDVEEHAPHGSEYFQGPQDFTAYGIEHVLNRTTVTGAFTSAGHIDRGLTFNKRDGRGKQLRGNMSSGVDGTGTHYFDANGDLWSNYQAIEYLIAHYAPAGMTYQIVGTVTALQNIYQDFNPDGMKLDKAIDRLIDKRRGLGWRPIVGLNGVVYLYVFSQLRFPIQFGDVYIPANTDQQIVSFDGLLDVKPQFRFDDSTRYDAVVARGGFVNTAFTLSDADGTLEKKWDSDQEDDYKASTASGEAEDEDAERKTAKYANVYTRFGVPAAWDKRAGDGEGGTKNYVSPFMYDDATLNPAAQSPLHLDEKTFNRTVPFDEAVGAATRAELRRAFVIATAPDSEGTDRFYFVHELSQASHPDCNVLVGDNGLELSINPSGLNHVAAKNHFDPETHVTGTDPIWDYESYIATVELETDTRVMAWYRLPTLRPAELQRVKYVDYPEAEMWYVLPGTVTDIEDGALVKHAGGLVRNDSPTIRVLCAMAAAWYLQPKNDLSFVVQGIIVGFPSASMIAGVASNWAYTNVSSVVTRRTWDFTTKVPTTLIETGYEAFEPQSGFVMGAQGGAARRGVIETARHPNMPSINRVTPSTTPQAAARRARSDAAKQARAERGPAGPTAADRYAKNRERYAKNMEGRRGPTSSDRYAQNREQYAKNKEGRRGPTSEDRYAANREQYAKVQAQHRKKPDGEADQ